MVRPSFIKSLNINGDSKMTIKDWIIEIVWYNQPCIFLRRVGRFILRLMRWIPILWNQEEWDFGYTYDILKHKIKEIRKCVSEDTWHTEECVKEELEQIDSVLTHLDKFRNWPDYIDIPDPPEGFERTTPTEDGLHRMNWFEGEREAFRKADEFEEEHYNAFWNEMKEHSGNWWT